VRPAALGSPPTLKAAMPRVPFSSPWGFVGSSALRSAAESVTTFTARILSSIRWFACVTLDDSNPLAQRYLCNHSTADANVDVNLLQVYDRDWNLYNQKANNCASSGERTASKKGRILRRGRVNMSVITRAEPSPELAGRAATGYYPVNEKTYPTSHQLSYLLRLKPLLPGLPRLPGVPAMRKGPWCNRG
jgi:hypothetical protein